MRTLAEQCQRIEGFLAAEEHNHFWMQNVVFHTRDLVSLLLAGTVSPEERERGVGVLRSVKDAVENSGLPRADVYSGSVAGKIASLQAASQKREGASQKAEPVIDSAAVA
jgi:hypothetical protein